MYYFNVWRWQIVLCHLFETFSKYFPKYTLFSCGCKGYILHSTWFVLIILLFVLLLLFGLITHTYLKIDITRIVFRIIYCKTRNVYNMKLLWTVNANHFHSKKQVSFVIQPFCGMKLLWDWSTRKFANIKCLWTFVDIQ